MSKKFKQILEGKHRNSRAQDMSPSSGYIVIHEICTDKILSPEEKMRVITGFCQNALTVFEISEYLKSENLDF